jgi:hypothetical protein
MLQRPTALGLILCQEVIIEEGTRRATLVNTMSWLRCKTFPSPPHQVVAYALLTDGMGDASMALTITRPDTLEELAEHRWRMSFTDPLRPVPIRARYSNLSFPVAGRYAFNLFADGELVTQTVLQVSS